MPHLTIDYAPNLAAVIDIAALCDTVRVAAIATGTFPMPGIRVRAFAATHTSIADGNPAHGYIDITVRLRKGRTTAAKRAAADAIFDAAHAYVAPQMATHAIALSLEIRDIDADLSRKSGSIRNHL